MLARSLRPTLLLLLGLIWASGGAGCEDEGVRASAQPQIHVDPPSGEFAETVVGSTETEVFRISNHGDADLLLSRVYISPEERTEFAITTEPDITRVPPGGETIVAVGFTPPAPGDYSATLIIECNDSKVNGRVEIPLNTRRVQGAIYAQPALLDFGSVDSGDRKVLHTDLVNSGAAAFEIRTLRLVNEARPNDFVITSMALCAERLALAEGEALSEGVDEGCDEASGVIVMEPGSRLRVKVGYEPTGGDTDQAVLRLGTTLDRSPIFEVSLLGSEPSPRLAVLPPELDFGPTPLEGRSETVILRNVGTGALALEEVYLAPTLDEAFSLAPVEQPDRLGGELTVCGRCVCHCTDPADEEGSQDVEQADVDQLECLRSDCAATCTEVEGRREYDPGTPAGCLDPQVRNDDRVLTVTYTPTCDHTSVQPAVGKIYIRTNDREAPPGGVQIPLMGRLDAPGIDVRPGELDFQLVPSGGQRSLRLSVYNIGSQPLTLASIAVVEDPEEFTILSPAETAGVVIQPGDNVPVELRYSPNAEHNSLGLLRIEHDSPCQETIEVPLRGRGGGQPFCRLLINPQQINYGTVAAGRVIEKSVMVRSIGTGPCRFDGAQITATLVGLPAPAEFRIVRTPPAIIDAWDQAELVIAYAPSRNLFDGHEGLAVVQTSDPNGGQVTETRIQLRGRTGNSEIQVLPQDLDFGLTTLGCASQTMVVTVYNVGAVNLTIDSVAIEPPAREFELLTDVDVPYQVSRAAPLQVEVRYVPQDTGVHTADLVFRSDAQNAGEFRVPMRGEGTLEDEVVDEFVQAEGQMVDVLFVVDNSGSMSDDQENLAQNFTSFVQAGDLLNPNSPVDFHMGVITTDLGGSENPFDANGEMGPDRGKLQGDARTITPDTPNFQAEFRDTVLVGDEDAGEQESGLETARAALSNQWQNDVPYGNCATDADCQDGEECVNRQCVGYNRGFLRDDASLEIVFLSDEEDQSPAQVSFYVDFFKSIKGFRNVGMLRCWAIVGDAPNGCQSNEGSADAGRRYIDVADATGGRFHSICDDSFAQAMQDIGHTAFSLRVQFFLSRVAAPDTVVVEVDGQPMPAQTNGLVNWEFDPESNSVIFLAEDAIPQPSQRVTIRYRARCFAI